jgi:hypothetical protein
VAGNCIGIDRILLSGRFLPTCWGLLAFVTAIATKKGSRLKTHIASIEEGASTEIDLGGIFAAKAQHPERTSSWSEQKVVQQHNGALKSYEAATYLTYPERIQLRVV